MSDLCDRKNGAFEEPLPAIGIMTAIVNHVKEVHIIGTCDIQIHVKNKDESKIMKQLQKRLTSLPYQ